MTDARMTVTLQSNKDIILIPRDWWQDETKSLEPEDPGWWYTVTKSVKFRECEVCQWRRGDDLDEEKRLPTTGNTEDVTKLFGNPYVQKRNREVRERLGRVSSSRRRDRKHRKCHEDHYVPEVRDRWGRRKLHYHHEGTKDITSNSVPSTRSGSVSNDRPVGIVNGFHWRRTRKYPWPSVGKTYVSMSPPGILGLHSSTSGSTVYAESSPLGVRNQGYGIREGMGHPGITHGGPGPEYRT
jgi:hypothetical protein